MTLPPHLVGFQHVPPAHNEFSKGQVVSIGSLSKTGEVVLVKRSDNICEVRMQGTDIVVRIPIPLLTSPSLNKSIVQQGHANAFTEVSSELKNRNDVSSHKTTEQQEQQHPNTATPTAIPSNNEVKASKPKPKKEKKSKTFDDPFAGSDSFFGFDAFETGRGNKTTNKREKTAKKHTTGALNEISSASNASASSALPSTNAVCPTDAKKASTEKMANTISATSALTAATTNGTAVVDNASRPGRSGTAGGSSGQAISTLTGIIGAASSSRANANGATGPAGASSFTAGTSDATGVTGAAITANESGEIPGMRNMSSFGRSLYAEAMAAQEQLIIAQNRDSDSTSRDFEKVLRQSQRDHVWLQLPRTAMPGDVKECPMCLLDFEKNEKIVRLPCLHAFHEACVEAWVKQRGTCPNCSIDICENA